jgi:hypothetical protein
MKHIFDKNFDEQIFKVFLATCFLCLLDARLRLDYSEYLFITFRSSADFSGFCSLPFCVLLNFNSIADDSGFQEHLLKFVYKQTINTIYFLLHDLNVQNWEYNDKVSGERQRIR